MGGAHPRYLFSCGNLGGLSCHSSILGCPVGPHLPPFAVVPSPQQHPPRSPPSPLLNENPHPSQFPTETAPPSAHPSMQRPSRTPTMTMSTTRRSATSLGSSRTPTPKIARHATYTATSSRYLLAQGSARRPTSRTRRFKFFTKLSQSPSPRFWATPPRELLSTSSISGEEPSLTGASGL